MHGRGVSSESARCASAKRRLLADTIDEAVRRLTPWVVAVAASLVAACVAARVLLAPQWDWNAARLMFAFALARGFDIYPTAGSEPAVGCIYGPVFPVAYLPATLLDSPTLAVLAATLLAVGMSVGPALAFLRSCAPADRLRWLGFVALVGTCLGAPPLRYSTFSVHADAPALGLLTGAAALWLRAASRQSTYLPAAFLVALALWCKQIVAPAALGLPLWSLLVSGRRSALRGCTALSVAGLVVSAIAIVVFGLPDLLFNLITLPGATPWYGSGTRLQRLGPVVRDYAIVVLPWLAALVTFAALHWRGLPAAPTAWRSWLQHHPWVLLALLSAVLAPASVLAKARFGGGVNSWTPSLYFLVLACFCAVLGSTRTNGNQAVAPWAARCARVLTLVYTVGVAARVALGGDLQDWQRHETRHPFANPQQQAHDFLLAHPGSTYFPWNPLAHLLAERRLVHYADGVIIRIFAGAPLSQEEFDRGVGRTFVYVAAAPQRRNEIVQARYLPQFSERVALPDLPEWTVYQVPANGR